ncbi:MAG: translocation/assembly module TamB domain-containing protein [Sphingobacteriia bacterium]|nr:translocation/assembly module TamB domain-containing protein [Sphingobacteriia bacterium]
MAIQTNYVQNKLVSIFTEKLSKELGTEVRIKNVSLSLLDKLNLEGTLVRDKQKDTILYAGSLKIRITDWFVFKEKADLKFIGLENAVIKLQRKDSTWNYQFIADHFSSPKSNKKKTGGGLELNIKKVDLKNVSFVENDLWRGERMKVYIGNLTADADEINLNNGKLAINEVIIDDPSFTLEDFKGLRPDSLLPKTTENHSLKDTALLFNTGNLLVHLKKLSVRNGSFTTIGNNKLPYTYFDGSHILFNKINLSLNDLTFIKDTLRTTMNLAARERSGLDVKQLKAHVKITPQIMEFAHLDLVTNKSKLGPYYAMKFEHFNNDFSEYITNVSMVASFKNSKVHSDDIAYFAPELKDWKKEVALNGNFNGTVANFTVKDFFASSGAASYASGDISMKGLPYINTTKIELRNGVIKSNYNDAVVLLPVLKNISSPNLSALGNIIFKGNFSGTINNFSTEGTIGSNLGGLYTNIQMKFPHKQEPTYAGNITTKQFNLGKFLEIDSLKNVSFEGKISGTGFDIDKVKTTIEGKISNLEYNGYNYRNITASSTLQKKYFNGELDIDDPSLEFVSHVEIDFAGNEPKFNIIGDLKSSDLTALHLTGNNLHLTGLIDVNFTGKNIDRFIGSAKMLNAEVKSDVSEFNFDSLSINSFYKDSVKHLQIESADFFAGITGEFNILDLPKSFGLFLSRYYPAYFSRPSTVPPNQNFNVAITTNYIAPYLKLIDERLDGFDDISINGSINTQKNTLDVNGVIPYAQFDTYALYDADINAKGDKDSIFFTSNINSIKVSDSLSFPNTSLSVKAANDHSIVSIKTKANNTLNEANLNADVFTLADGVRVRFNPSSFVLNNKSWNLEKQGEIVIRKNFASAQNVKFYQGFQEIAVETEEEDGGNTHNLIVHLKDVVLGDITNLFMQKPKLEGVLNGNIHLNNFYGKFNVEANLKADEFRFDNDSVGTVNINSTYASTQKLLSFKGNSPNKDYTFDFKGSYNLNPGEEKPLDVSMDLHHTKIEIVEQFIGDIFSNIKGYATGDFRMSGNPNAPTLGGNLKLENASMKVLFTQVSYRIDSAFLQFQDDGIDFGRFVIYDSANNKGFVRGKLYEKEFKNLNFDFDLSTQKLLLLNTTAKDNKSFYGKAVGKAELSLKGPETNALMRIAAEVSDSSHINIVNSTSKESGNADFIVFKQIGTAVTNENQKSNFNLTVDLDVTSNNKLGVNIILDEVTGDAIAATGDGRLKIRVGTSEPLSIKGRYNIEKGNYNFNFQSIIRKPFILKQNAGNYIEWNGDPYDADIHIAAQYTAENVTTGDLLSSQKDNSSYNASTKSYRGPVYIIATLTDKLSQPRIAFNFDFPQNSPLKTDPTFNALINKIEKDDNEMLKQTTFLIVFNTFYPYGEGGTTTGVVNFTAIGINSISSIVTGQLNNAISNILYRITKDKSFKFDIGTYFYSSSDYAYSGNTGVAPVASSPLDRSRVNFKFGKSFLNDNIIVTLGGDLDFGFAATQTGTFQWLPDINVEVVIIKNNNRNERLGALIFSKTSPDAINNQTFGKVNRQGIGLSYKRDFERLFARKEDEMQIKKFSDSSSNKKKN